MVPEIRTPTRRLCAGIAVAAAVVLVAAPAGAQRSFGDNFRGQDFVNTGGYMVLGGLTGFEVFQADGGQQFDNSLGFVLKGGARFNPYIAAEVEGNFLSGFDTVIDLTQIPGGVPPGLPPFVGLTVDGGNITANAVVYFPLGRIQPKAILGVGGMWARLRTTNAVTVVCGGGFYWYCRGAYAQLGSNGGFVMRYGGGADVYIGEDWALTLEASFVQPFGGIEELRYVNLNWGVRFDFD